MRLTFSFAVLLLATPAFAEPATEKPDAALTGAGSKAAPPDATRRDQPKTAAESAAADASASAVPAEADAALDAAAETAAVVDAAVEDAEAGAADAAVDAAAAPVASAPPKPVSAEFGTVRIGDTAVFTVRAGRPGKTVQQRAKEASDNLKRALELEKDPVVRMVPHGDVVIVTVGQTPIVQLSTEDADLAGDSSLEVHAQSVVAKIREAIEAEQRRSAIAKSVFSFSLVVFFGLIAFYLIKKLGEFVDRAREWLDNKADHDLTIHVRRIELMRPATLRGTATLALSVGRWIGQFGIAYAWLVIVLSMFESTRDYTQRLTGFVVGPLSQMMERLATALPLLIVAVLAALAVFVLVRFVGLFFASVARGETPLSWLPADLAAPTSVLLRCAIVIAGLVFAAPVVTGDPNGALARAGAVIMVALGLASTPLLACALLGSAMLYGRRLRVGDFAEIAGRTGRVFAINLLEVRLRDADQAEIRIPHLFSLVQPMRVLGVRPRISVDVRIAASAPQADVRTLLEAVALKFGRDARVDLLSIDADTAHYQVSVACEALDTKAPLQLAMIEALAAANVAFARARQAGAA